jgi:hypothetical protein
MLINKIKDYYAVINMYITIFIAAINPKINDIKKYIIKNYKLICGYYILFMWLVFIFSGIIIFKNHEIKELKNKKTDLSLRVINLEKDLNYEKTQRKVEIKMLDEKVDALTTFIKRTYPYFDYDYKKMVDNAITHPDQIEKLPDDLFNIYVKEKFIKPHGLENYQMTLKDMSSPLEKNSCFTTCKDSEYGTYRPYAYYGYKHEGLDLYTYYNYSVYSVYNSQVYKVYYEEGGGWTIELKFKYRLQDGNQGFYFVRYRHLQEIMVKVGDVVKKGEVIASMGTTGTFSSGIHLHFELWRFNGQRYININPVLNSTWENKVIPRLFY